MSRIGASTRELRNRPAAYGRLYGMEKTTVYLPADLKRALERTARAQGRSEAELVRRGVEYVTGSAPAPEPLLPLFLSEDEDLADHVDEALAGFGER